MKAFAAWILAGTIGLVLLGLSGLLLGFLLPGNLSSDKPDSVVAKSRYTEIKKKADNLVDQLEKELQRPTFPGTNKLAHRVFVSRTLVFLPEDKNEPVQPLDRNLKMQDGVEVGWKLDHGFDPADPAMKDGDADQDGFTNLEEYANGTDPNDKNSSPSRWLKIKIASVESNSLVVGLSGKSADRYTLRFVCAGKKKDVDVGLGDQLWLVTHAKGFEALRQKEEVKKFQDLCPHAIPIQVKAYHDDRGKRLDEKTKTENDYDDSYLEIERLDGLRASHKILLDERGKSRGVTWLVGDIRLISLVPGEGEMGPYRVGQSFAYAGKEFLIREATTHRVALRIEPGGEEVQILPKTP